MAADRDRALLLRNIGVGTGVAVAVFALSYANGGFDPTTRSYAGIAGPVYLGSAIVLGLALFVLSARFAAQRSESSARALFFGSIIYLPLLWIVLIADKL